MKYCSVEPLESRIAPATLSIGSVSLPEGNSGETHFDFIVTLADPPAAENVTVNFATAIGTATTDNDDFVARTGTLTFLPGGALTQMIRVVVNGDVVGEADETFTVVLSTPSANATITADTGTGTILNDPGLVVASASGLEGNTGTTALNFTVTLSEAPLVGPDITVDFATADGTDDNKATLANNDYLAGTGTLTFIVGGSLTQTIAVQVVGDIDPEADENFKLALSNPVGATILQNNVFGTIRNDPLTITTTTPTIVEGAGGTTNLVFTVELSDFDRGGNPVSVSYNAISGTATSGVDFSATSGTLVFAVSDTTKTVSVPIYGDTAGEGDETFTFTANGTGALSFSTSLEAKILNDDFSVNIADPTPIVLGAIGIAEGGSGVTTELKFPVTLSGAPQTPITIHYRTVNGAAGPRGAIGGQDFTEVTAGTLVFNPGDAVTKDIVILLTGDTTAELGENFTVEIIPDAAYTIGDGSALGTIRNDDFGVSIVADGALTEGDSGTSLLGFTVNLTQAFTEAVTVTYSTVNGTASAAVTNPDFIAVTNGTVTIPANATSARVFVSVRGDFVDESNETFSVRLAANPIDFNYPLGDSATATITDDDPNLRINDVTITEGTGGFVTAVFTVSLSAAQTREVRVDYATADDTAKDGVGDTLPDDYVAQTGTLTFAAGETVKTISVQVAGDARREFSEKFAVTLSNALLQETTTTTSAFAITRATGEATILDNDVNPTLSIADVSVSEGAFGATNATFTVTLSTVSDFAVTGNFNTANGTATDAGANPDFVGVTGGIFTIPAGQSSGTFVVAVSGDGDDELDETFQVQLTNGNIDLNGGESVAFTRSLATGTILNDDRSVTIDSPSVGEGNGGTTPLNFNVTLFTVTLSADSDHDVVVFYATRENGSATAGSDFTPRTGSITIPGAGNVTTGVIPILIVGDLVDEANQTFEVVLTGVTNAAGAGLVGTGTITDDDATPTVQIAPTLSTTEAAADSTATFTVTLSGRSESAVTVNYSTTAGTAASGTDFTEPAAAASVTIPAGALTATFPITIKADVLDEAAETFTVTLATPVNANLGAQQTATATIVDNDASPTLSIGDFTGHESAGTFTFVVTLSAVSGQAVTVAYGTLDSTATLANADYVATTNTLTFNPGGPLTQSITVTVNPDAVAELDERFLVRLSAPVNATLLQSDGTGTIQNDETAFTVQPLSILEEGAGDTAQTALVRVNRTGTGVASVQFTTAEGTAKAGTGRDFTTVSGTLNFAANETFKDISIPILKDLAYENNETFTVVLSNPVNGVFAAPADATGTVTITDNDAAPTLSVADVQITEGSANLVFAVRLSAPNERDAVTVQFQTVDGTAVSSGLFVDYTTSSGELRFAAGETAKFVSVTVGNDTRDEDDQSMQFVLNNPNGAVIVDGTATGTIVDNDAAPTITLGNLTLVENESGVSTRVFNTTLSAPSEKVVTVSWRTDDGATGTTATAGADYTSVPLTLLTYTPGQANNPLTVLVADDATDEHDETFEVVIQGATNATIADARGLGTITDNDAAPSISINDVSIVEGAAPLLVFTVSLSAPSGKTVTFEFATADGSAKASGPFADYAAAASLLGFLPGETTRTISIAILDDTYREGVPVQGATDYTLAGEKFTIALNNPINATLGDATGEGTIENDGDSVVGLAVSNAGIVEGDTGTSNLSFQVQLSAPVPAGVTFTAATRNGTAVGGSDFAAKTEVLGIEGDHEDSMNPGVNLPGATSAAFVVTIAGDTAFEATEAFFVDVTGVSAAAVPVGADLTGRVTVRGTIFNDEAQILNGGRTAQWIDVDGDLVTLNITRGVLSSSQFTFASEGAFGGRILQSLNLSGSSLASYAGASISIVADAQPGFGGVTDGRVNVGAIFAGFRVGGELDWVGVDLTDVTVDGDLGRIQAGDSISTRALRKLDVYSLGARGTATDGADVRSEILGPVTSVIVRTDLAGQLKLIGQEFGVIGTLRIDGALRGGTPADTGQVIVSGRVGTATIGAIIGGAGDRSGLLLGNANNGGSLGNVTVLGAITGAAGDDSGSIQGTSLGRVVVESIAGGAGDRSGSVVSASSLLSLTVEDSIVGGGGISSGEIFSVGAMGPVRIGGDLVGGAGDTSGSLVTRVGIAGVVIGGAVIGGSGPSSGSILGLTNTSSLGDIRIAGGLFGGSATTAANSGKIEAGRLGNVTLDKLIGGGALQSGAILSATTIGTVVVAHEIAGGAGTASGLISGTTGVREVRIGENTAGDSLIGGAGQNSGRVFSGGLMNAFTTTGDIQGGTGIASGGLEIGNAVRRLVIGGDLAGANSPATGAAVQSSGYLSIVRIINGVVTGDLIAGVNGGAGIANSGVIRAGSIDALRIDGDLRGTAANPAIISATGDFQTSNLAIASLTIRGNVEFGAILAGYGSSATVSNVRGQLTSADAQISRIVIDGSVQGLDIVAGAAPGTGGRFGDATDVLSSGTGVRDSARVISQIASVIVRGSVLANADTFGIVAQHLVSVRTGAAGTPLAGLTRGAGNDTAAGTTDLSDLIAANFRAVEIGV